MRNGSPYSTGVNHKINANMILPLTIAVKNNEKPRSIYLLLREIIDEKLIPTNYVPVDNGYQVLDSNPSDVVYMNAEECKLFKFIIQINTEQYQCFEAVVINQDNDKELRAIRIHINNPKYSNRDLIPYDESALCNYDTQPDTWY